jgi:hypothetical protein
MVTSFTLSMMAYKRALSILPGGGPVAPARESRATPPGPAASAPQK